MNDPQDPLTSKLRETALDYSLTGGNSTEYPQSPRVMRGTINNFQTHQLPQSAGKAVDAVRTGIQEIATGQTTLTIESVISNRPQDPPAGTTPSLEQPDGDHHSTSMAIAIFNRRNMAKAA